MPSASRSTLGAFLLTMAALLAAAVQASRAASGAPAVIETGADPVAASTREMAALLVSQAAQVDPMRISWVVNDRRAAILAGRLGRPAPLDEHLKLRMMYGLELLHSGKIREAITEIDNLERSARTRAPAIWDSNRSEVLLLKAVAWLRLGEEQNCHQGNTPDSCLLPIQGSGVHRKPEGSTRAIEVLGELLDLEPDNLNARWLLNVAHMTLGSWPDGVPARLLIPPTVFQSQYPLPRFPNVAKAAGLDIYGHAGGAILDDFDNDSRLDLVVSATGFEDQVRFFRNGGGGAFEERTAASGITGETGGLNMIQADYDNDGFTDILVLRGGWMKTEGKFPLSLLRNDGDGTFTDVTRAAGLLRFSPTQTAVWFDYDGDGWLDLFVGNESESEVPGSASFHPCELFRNSGDGTFRNVARELGVDFSRFVKGVTSADYDNDGRPDLYLSTQGGGNLLLHNDGPVDAAPGDPGWRFTNVAAEAGVLEPDLSFGSMFFDYDNDGWTDLFVAGYGAFKAGDVAADYLGLPTRAERCRLYRNRGDGSFEDVSQATGLFKVVPAMGLNFGDLDNDGFLDIYLGTGNPDLRTLVPNRMFRNAGGRYFQDVTVAGDFGHLQKGHAIAFGDVDNDGDQDIFEQMGGAFLDDRAWSALYENPGTRNRWLGLELEGVRSNRRGQGARIKVTVEGKTGRRVFNRTVGTGGSFGGSPLRQEIGLGDATGIVSVEIFWPASGRTQQVQGLRLDHRYRVKEGVEAAVPVVRTTD